MTPVQFIAKSGLLNSAINYIQHPVADVYTLAGVGFGCYAFTKGNLYFGPQGHEYSFKLKVVILLD